MKIICIGDSLTYGYPYDESSSWTGIIAKENNWEMINFGVNGEGSGEILQRVMKNDYFKDRGIHVGSDAKADKAIIMCGSNDFVYGLCSFTDVLANILQIAMLAKKESITSVIMLPILCKPAQAREAWLDGMGVDYEEVNRNLKLLKEELPLACENFGFEFIDLQTGYEKYNKYTDGLHPTKEGYDLIAKIIKEDL